MCVYIYNAYICMYMFFCILKDSHPLFSHFSTERARVWPRLHLEQSHARVPPGPRDDRLAGRWALPQPRPEWARSMGPWSAKSSMIYRDDGCFHPRYGVYIIWCVYVCTYVFKYIYIYMSVCVCFWCTLWLCQNSF